MSSTGTGITPSRPGTSALITTRPLSRSRKHAGHDSVAGFGLVQSGLGDLQLLISAGRMIGSAIRPESVREFLTCTDGIFGTYRVSWPFAPGALAAGRGCGLAAPFCLVGGRWGSCHRGAP